jgi:AcrR family transcriptional regulator
VTDPGGVRRGPGRPPSTHAQEAIRKAAARLFAARSYGSVSVREVAAAAGVDASLVIRHFGSKEALFLQTMTVDEAFRGLVEGPLEDLGRLILERLLTVRGGAAVSTYAALIGAIDRPEVRSYLEASADRHVVRPLAERLTGPDRELRARLVASQVNGLLFDLRGSADAGLAGRPTGEVLSVYARALQALIDDPTA